MTFPTVTGPLALLTTPAPSRTMTAAGAYSAAADVFASQITALVPSLNTTIADINTFVASLNAFAATTPSGVNGTSTSSVALPAATGGSIAFTYIETTRAVVVGQFITVARTAAPATDWLVLQVTAWNSGTQQVTGTVVKISGTVGTYAAWTLSLSGAVGVAGTGGKGTGATEAGAGNITLVAGSNFVSYGAFTAHGQGWTMPDATTMTLGLSFTLNNPTQYWVTARDANAKLLAIIAPMSEAIVSIANIGSVGGKWSVDDTPMAGMTALASFGAALLGSAVVRMIPVPLDALRTMIVICGTNLYAVVCNKATGSWGAMTLIRSGLADAGEFSAIKSATDQVLVCSAITTALEAVTLTTVGTAITVNSGTKGTATLAGAIGTGYALSQQNSFQAPMQFMAQYNATTFLLPYSRATTLGGLRAITVAGTTPTIGAEVSFGAGLASGAVHFYINGTVITVFAYGSVNAVFCYTVAGSTLTQTGTAALASFQSSGTTPPRSMVLGTRWLIVGIPTGGGTSVSASLVSVAAGVPTVSSAVSVITTSNSFNNESTDLVVANGKAVIVGMDTVANLYKLNVLTDTAGTLSKGTELSWTPATGIAIGANTYQPLGIGTSGTDAIFQLGNIVARISAAAASATISAINYGAQNALNVLSVARCRGHYGYVGSTRAPGTLYAGNIAVMLPSQNTTTANGIATQAVALNALDAAPFLIPMPHQLISGAQNDAYAAALGSNTETWQFLQNTTSEPFQLSCFEAMQP